MLTTGGTLHNLSDQWDLLGPPHSPTPETTGRPEANETAQNLACSHRGITSAASQVRTSCFSYFPPPLPVSVHEEESTGDVLVYVTQVEASSTQTDASLLSVCVTQSELTSVYLCLSSH